jgi:dipeptidyl aminopeptidase/acylaminoacyl peptidase
MTSSPRAVAFALLAAGCGQVHPTERSASPSPSPARPCDGAPVAPDPWRRGASSQTLAARAEALASMAQEIGPVFSHDGRSVVYSSSRGGQPELYVAPRERPGEARRLPGTANSVLGQQFTWDDRAVLFTADRNGDERWRILRADLTTGEVIDLTPTPLNAQGFTLPEGAPDTVFCAGLDMASGSSTIYALPATRPGEPRILYRDARQGRLADVSRDGRFGLFIRFGTYQEQQVLRVDFASGGTTVLYPRTGAATIKDAALSADGTRALVATDGGGEGVLVLALDATSGEEWARYVERELPSGNIDQIAAAQHGNTLAFKLDAGDHAVVRVLDQATLAPLPPIHLPLGVGHFGLSDDGEHLLVSWSTPEMPPSLFLVAARTGQATRVSDARRTAVALDVSLTRVPSFDGLALPVIVVRPAGATGRLPVVVDLHGGPAASAATRWSVLTQLLASGGIAVVQPNIRGSGGFGRAFEGADDGPKRPDAFRDLDVVHDWVARQPWVDPSRLAVSGASFGGYLVLQQLTTRPHAWRAGVDQFGIADLTSFMATTSGPVRQNYLHELGDPQTDTPFLRSISPLPAAGQIASPLFVYAGATDPRVPRSQSDCIVGTLRERGVRVEYMVASDEGHGARKRSTQIEMSARIVEFLQRALAP